MGRLLPGTGRGVTGEVAARVQQRRPRDLKCGQDLRDHTEETEWTNLDNILDMERERVKAEESEMETVLVGDRKARCGFEGVIPESTGQCPPSFQGSL